ncbi:MAG: TonB-dependent receptor plug domain-containing protein [Endomicrobia bacterium]|nr:TonB-dependent receptor plug domain-containing protein [Endomicrobiia bacterium]
MKKTEVISRVYFFIMYLLVVNNFVISQEQSIEDLLFSEEILIVSASKFEEKLMDAPATVIVITEQQIEERGYQDLKDVLLDISGLDVTPNVGGENGGWQVLMRGIFGNNKIQVLLNGIRLNPASGDRFVWGNNIPLGNIKRIEIIYGPASALYGADAFAGIINLITKDVHDINGNKVFLGYGTVNTRTYSYLFGKKFSNDIKL